ncbi:MAG: hypothetical protein FWC39_09240 [Bacteroidetes bacterium]|nr:hypothetical protein [Bacteroidota bacterium]
MSFDFWSPLRKRTSKNISALTLIILAKAIKTMDFDTSKLILLYICIA